MTVTLKDLTLLQKAYFDINNKYTAAAKDKNGDLYVVQWEITAEDFDSLTDESEACDWDNPISITTYSNFVGK